MFTTGGWRSLRTWRLVEPTSYGAFADGTAGLPSNLRSHAVQIVSMQTGYARSSATTGWGGRLLDQLETHNSGATPVSISMGKLSLYCSGVTTQDITLQPGNKLAQQGLGPATDAAGQAGSPPSRRSSPPTAATPWSMRPTTSWRTRMR